MKRIFRACPTLLAALVAGCGATLDYDDLRRLDVRGGDFNAHLSREYKEFALYENDDMGDWPDAAHFKRKAFLSALGRTPKPEPLEAWTLPAASLAELGAQRRRLVAALEAGARTAAPKPAARAQAMFDCWLEQQEEGFQPAHIEKCRRAFYRSLKRVQERLHASGAAAEPAAFTVFFAFDSARLDSEQTETLDAVAAAAKAGEPVRLVVSGHADRAGPEIYNLTLSRKRALNVEGALLRRGLSRDRVAITVHGETRPRVTTPDGAREPRNRRVEIILGPAAAL